MPIFHLATDAISGDRDPDNPNLQTFYVLFARLFFGDAITPHRPRQRARPAVSSWSCSLVPR